MTSPSDPPPMDCLPTSSIGLWGESSGVPSGKTMRSGSKTSVMPDRLDVAPDLLTRLATVRLVAFDFDGVFTDNTVYVNEDGKETVRCWRSDGLGLARLREIGIQAVVVST